MTSSAQAMPGPATDTRTGSSDAMNAVQSACQKIQGQSGLYDCKGRAAALATSTATPHAEMRITVVLTALIRISARLGGAVTRFGRV